MDRRSFLVGAGTTVTALSGCQGFNISAPRGQATPTIGGRHAVGEASDNGITISDVTVREAIQWRSTPDSLDAMAPSDRLLLFAAVDATGADGDPPAHSAFSLQLDGTKFDPITTLGGVSSRTIVYETSPYNPPWARQPSAVGYLLFDSPRGLEPGDGWIILDGNANESTARWRLAQPDLTALAPPYADITVKSLDVPKEVSGESIPVSMTVGNRGGADGTLRAAVNHMGPLWASRTWNVSVNAGETTEAETSLEYEWGDDGAIRFAVLWPGDGQSFSVDIDG